jgi:hypothetical protein
MSKDAHRLRGLINPRPIKVPVDNPNPIPAKSVIDGGITWQRHARKVTDSCMNRPRFEHDAESTIGIFGLTADCEERAYSLGGCRCEGMVTSSSYSGVSETSAMYAI